MQESKSVKGVPRRYCIEEMTGEEKQVMSLVKDIESLGCSDKLTEAICLLSDARNALADHIESIMDNKEE